MTCGYSGARVLLNSRQRAARARVAVTDRCHDMATRYTRSAFAFATVSPQAAGANRRSLCCMALVVVSLVIILAIALLIGAVFLARKLDRDEPGPTVVRSYKDEYRRGSWRG